MCFLHFLTANYDQGMLFKNLLASTQSANDRKPTQDLKKSLKNKFGFELNLFTVDVNFRTKLLCLNNLKKFKAKIYRDSIHCR